MSITQSEAYLNPGLLFPLVASLVYSGLLLGAAFSFVTGLVFGWVGRVVSQRALVGSDRLANQLFVLWWYSMAGLSFIGAGFNLVGAWGRSNLAMHIALLYVALLVICLALWGLAYYLFYLFMGDSRLLVPLGVFYGVYFVFLLYLVTAANPIGVEAGAWQMQLKYAHEFSDQPFVRVLGLFLVVPQLIGAALYMSLLFRPLQRVHRYRVAMVSGSLLGWFGSSLVASILQLNQTVWWPPVSRLISLVAAFGILAAYRPPKAVLRWLSRERRVATSS